MAKDLTSQELRDFGYPELAFYQEQKEAAEREKSASEPQVKNEETAAPVNAAPPTEKEKTVAELKNLLGPLVNSLLRDPNGALDLAKIKTETFAEFKQFLQDQVSIDGIAFNEHLLASYHRVLGNQRYERLLKLLWEQIQNPSSASTSETKTTAEQTSPPEEAPRPRSSWRRRSHRNTEEEWEIRHLLSQFTADLISVSAERFVRNNISNKEGRQRLRHVLGEVVYYAREIRADIVKAVASVGEAQGYDTLSAFQSQKQISSWNYFNVNIDDDELKKAASFAEEILHDADWHEDHLQKTRRRYLEHPEKVRTIPRNVEELNSPITPERIQSMYRLSQEKQGRDDPVSRIHAKLANFWLLAADSDCWIQENLLGGYGTRAYLVNQVEHLLEAAESVETEADFLALNEKVQDFLHGPLNATGNAAWNWIKHQTVGYGLADVFAETTSDLKAPYADLLQFSDEISHAIEMGEKIRLRPPSPPAPQEEPFKVAWQAPTRQEIENRLDVPTPLLREDKIPKAAEKLISGLDEAKRHLWYGYKQHRAVSRLLSNMADVVGAGDIADIRKANQEIDQMIARLEKASTKDDIQTEIDRLHVALGEDGTLHEAFEAAEMDGTEQLLGLVQTVAVIIGTTLVTEGMGTAGALANATKTAAAMRTGFSARSVYGMKMGAWISFAENGIAKATGEVRQGDDTLLSWGKDSLATGLAMGLFTPFAAKVGHGVEKNILQRMITRYTPAKGLVRFAGDTALEGLEEIFDAGLRQGLDGKSVALGWDQLREIVLVTSAGGGTKVGTIAEGFHGPHADLEMSQAKESAKPSDSAQTESSPTTQAATETTEPDLPQTIGRTLKKARALFQEHGLSETHVSLREVSRIREYLRTFAPTMGMARATVMGLWLTLGAHLTPEQRQGELGTKLKELILQTEVPGISSDQISTELAGELDPQVPILDPNQDPDTNLFHFAARGTFFQDMSREDRLRYRILHLDKLSPEAIQETVREQISLWEEMGDMGPVVGLPVMEELNFQFALSDEQFQALIRGVQESGIESSQQIQIYGFLGRNSLLTPEQISRLLQWIADGKEPGDSLANQRTYTSLSHNSCLTSEQIEARLQSLYSSRSTINQLELTNLCKHPNLSPSSRKTLVSWLRRKGASHDLSFLDLIAETASGPNVLREEFAALRQYIHLADQRSDPTAKVRHLAILGQSSHIDDAELNEILDQVLVLPPQDAVQNLVLLCQNPNLTQEQFQRVLQFIEQDKSSTTHILTYSRIGNIRNLTAEEFSQLRRNIDLIQLQDTKAEAQALASLARNRHAPSERYNSLFREIAQINRETAVELLGFCNSNSQEQRDQLFEQFEEIEAKVEELKKKTPDQTARVDEAELRELIDPQPLQFDPALPPHLAMLKAAAAGGSLAEFDPKAVNRLLVLYDQELSLEFLKNCETSPDLILAAEYLEGTERQAILRKAREILAPTATADGSPTWMSISDAVHLGKLSAALEPEEGQEALDQALAMLRQIMEAEEAGAAPDITAPSGIYLTAYQGLVQIGLAVKDRRESLEKIYALLEQGFRGPSRDLSPEFQEYAQQASALRVSLLGSSLVDFSAIFTVDTQILETIFHEYAEEPSVGNSPPALSSRRKYRRFFEQSIQAKALAQLCKQLDLPEDTKTKVLKKIEAILDLPDDDEKQAADHYLPLIDQLEGELQQRFIAKAFTLLRGLCENPPEPSTRAPFALAELSKHLEGDERTLASRLAVDTLINQTEGNPFQQLTIAPQLHAMLKENPAVREYLEATMTAIRNRYRRYQALRANGAVRITEEPSQAELAALLYPQPLQMKPGETPAEAMLRIAAEGSFVETLKPAEIAEVVQLYDPALKEEWAPWLHPTDPLTQLTRLHEAIVSRAPELLVEVLFSKLDLEALADQLRDQENDQVMQTVCTVFNNLISDPGYDQVRGSAIARLESLGRLVADKPVLLNSIFGYLEAEFNRNKNDRTVAVALVSLPQNLRNHPALVKRVFKILQSDLTEPGLRLSSAVALGELGAIMSGKQRQAAFDRAIEVLSEIPESDPYYYTPAVLSLAMISRHFDGVDKNKYLGSALDVVRERLKSRDQTGIWADVAHPYPTYHKKALIFLIRNHPEAREALRAEIENIQNRYLALRAVSPESVARAEEIETKPKLSTHLQILSLRLRENNPDIHSQPQVTVHPDFDPTLVTAHKLTNQTVQALAINRFVLISGDSACGKSEVGRYISDDLNWDSHVFNAHRYLSEEEVMQKIGIVANGKTRFTITDGPLADALINGKLFILNEIHRAKAGNLSFLFNILADIDTEFDYYDASTGRTVRRKIHPNFRMIATRNLDGSNMNGALKNRAIEIHADSYSDLELAALIRSKHPELRDEGGSDLADTLVRFYEDLGHRMEAKAIGEHAEGYAWNLRHLMRIAEGFAEAERELEAARETSAGEPQEAEQSSAQDILQIMWDRVGVSLTPQDRANFFDAVRNFEYEGVTISEADVLAFKAQQDRLTLEEVVTALEVDTERLDTLCQQIDVRDIPTSARYLYSIVQSLQEGYHPSLKGPAGTGKSKLARLAGSLLGNVHMDALTPQTDSSRLKGEFKPTLIDVDGEPHLGFQHVPSHLVDALRDRSSTGLVTCILDEAAHGRPDVVEELHTLLDRDGGIWVVSEDGKTIEFLERPENFRLILASNTYGYEGVNLQSEAFRSRTHEIFMDFEYSPAEITALLCAQESASPAEISLGQTLHSARQLFLDHGEPVDSVTLREVGRIRNYQEAFLPDTETVTPEQQAAVAVHAFWLTLGAHLPKEKREGELGQKLQELITKIEIPGVEPTTLATELHQIVQPKPLEFDSSQSSTEAILRVALRGSFVENLELLPIAKFLQTTAPQLSFELLQTLCEDADHYVRLVAAKTLISLSGRLDGEEKQQALDLALSTLIKLCRDENTFIVGFAIEGLGELSKHLKENKHALDRALSTLRQLWEEGDAVAAQTLRSLSVQREGEEEQQDFSQILSILQELSGHHEPGINRLAAEASGILKAHLAGEGQQDLSQISSTLQELCRNESRYVIRNAAQALGLLSMHLEGDEKQQALTLALSTLQILCRDESLNVHLYAADALSELAAEIPEVQEWLNAELSPLVQRYEELKLVSTDSTVRISPLKGDRSDLVENMLVLAETLREHEASVQESPQVAIHPDFDPTLVTAHKLTNQTVQALAINRFVLISGDPASGKSEVGRYISEDLNWDCHVFNAHRYVSEEEVMQKIGIVANGKTRFTITDGPLADALINGKLFILNEIHRAKAGNLSFLFNILADIDTEFDYYDASTGRTVRRKIHPNFRMIATRNLDGSNMNGALKNRAIEIHADSYSDLELAALIRSKHPAFATATAGAALPDTLVRFYSDLGHRMEAKAIGEHAEGYAWNLRHLMRIAEGFSPAVAPEAGAEAGALSPQQILQIMWDRVGESLTPQDRANFFDAVRNFEYEGVTISEADVQAFREQQEQLTLAQVAQELDIDPERLAALCREMGVRDIPTSARYLRSIVQALQEGYHPSLKGPAGTGKSKLARLGGALLGNVHMDALTPQTDSSRLKGEFKPTLIEVGGEAHLGFQHVPSHLIDALRDRTSTGLITCLLDEAAHGRPDVVEELHTLLDRDGGIWVVSEDGKTIEFLERPENFRLILASNTYGYEGVNLQSQAFRSRTHEIFMDFEYSPAEITALLCAQESASPAEISLGQTLHSARQLFLDHGEPADSVTLREVGRIRNYQEAFLPDAEIVTPEQQAAVAVHAFWLTLGAHLPKEKREGELGQKLQELITKIEIPRVEPTTLATELHQIVQPKPVEFDTSQSITKALVHAAFQGSFVEYLSILNLAQLLRALAPRLSFELLQELCRHENPYTLRSAAEGLVSLSEHLEGEEKQQALDLALSILQKQCEGEDTFNIWPAAVVLGNLSAHLTGNKQALTSVFSALQTLCGNEDPDACRYAAEALGKLSAQLEGEEKQQALGLALSTLKTLCSALSTLKRLSNDEFNVRQKVPETLGRLSAYLTGNKEALDQALFILQKLCEHEHHPAVLQHAAEAWGKLGALHEGDKDTLALALSALQKFCKNESPSVRRYAAEALGRLSAQLEGEEKQQALALGLSTLQTLCRDKNAEICQAAIKTLEKFSVHLEGNKQALAVVLSLLQTLCKDQNFFIHPAAAQALGSLSSYLEGEEKQQALALAFSTLQTLWEDEPWIVCPPLVSLSEHLEGDKKQQALELALSALRTLCGDKSQTVRQLATEGLGSLSKRLEGEENQQRLALALSILRTLCSDNDASIRSSAAKILSDLATKIPEVREKLNNDLLLFVRQYEELKTASTDSVVRISPLKGDSTDLPQNMLVFAETLRKQDSGIQESPQVSIHPDFDPTLVTAHKLTNQTVQALAINRFVLISGDPASGKSEVGRYISDELDWNSHVFNAHRYVSEEEVMQKIGIVANGKTRFTITDGPLADALINGKLFILNEIHRAKAGNLSFLFNILADIDTEFDYYDASTGRTVRRKIHPNFRMIATRNLDGSNMNAALKNRAIEIHADAYSDLELAALIRSKHPELRDEGGSDLADTLVRFYEDLGHRMEAKAIGEHAEGYAWNLRHLMRIAEGFAEDEHSSPQGILQIMWDRVGVSLTPEDRANFFDAVRNFEYAGVTISEADVQAFREQQEQLTLAQVAQELDIDPERLAALCREMGVRDIPTSARYLRSIVQALQEGYHPSLKGPAGTGKSKLARLAGAVVGNVHMDALTPQTDSSRLKGEFKPTLIDVDGEPHLGFQHVPSHLVDALRDRASTGLITCILDEAAHGRPDVVEELHTLLDRDGGIWVVSEDGKTIEFLERPENFRLILASNTYGYEGVNLQSEAFRSRTHEIFMDFEYTAEELDKLLGIQTKPPLSPPSGTLSHKGRGKNASSGFARASSSPTLSQTSVALASPPAMARSFGTARAYTQRIQPIPAHATQPMLQTWGNPVRDKLAQFQGQIPESVIAELERKYAEVESRLLGAAAAMGRTGEIVMEFDPSQETCAMSLEAPRVFLVGANFLLHRTADELILIALHEGGHADISRIGTGFFFQSEVYRALTNIVDDVRVNARVVDRVPGRAEEYKAFLRNYYYEGYQKLPKDEIPELLPHEAFMQAIMSREYGESSPWDNDPLVGPALEEVQDAVQRAKASRPREDNPDEMSVQRHVAQMEGITREEILPAYLRLYRESLQQIEEMLRQAPPPKDGDGTPGGGGRRVPIDPKDLSEEARKILEKRAKSIADQHAPKDLGNRQARARQHFGDDTPDQAPPPPKPGKPPKPGSLEEALGKRHQDYRRQQGDLKRTPYSKLLSDLKSLPEKVFRVFERLLKPNTDFEFEGYFTSGPRPDIERAIKAIHGLLANLKVFKRKTEPTARDWRFSLLVDASQSMDDGGTHERGGMGLAALFVDVFERLNLPYGLDAFHNSYIPLKGFGQRLRNVTEKNNFFNTIQFSYWGLGGTNIRGGIRGALNRIDRARQGDPREQEFLFVLTDGRETHQEGATIRELCEEAAKRGIIVVGIGIGEGMQTVREHFPVHLVEKNPEQLPQLLAEFIKEYVQSTEEGP